ncbi:MAG: hypothetical protein RKO66_02145 [Candidatus Contendobacter sp.]|nr:hypothetical protein [Candidatus Contendobacter sp.]
MPTNSTAQHSTAQHSTAQKIDYFCFCWIVIIDIDDIPKPMDSNRLWNPIVW